MTEREAYMAFHLTEQIGSVGVAKLAEAAGSVAAAWARYPHHVSRLGRMVDVEAEFGRAAQQGTTVLTPVDADYPEPLRRSAGHPLVLYVRGNVAALNRPALAIVGTRRASAYGLDQAERFGYDLAAAGWSVVSGLALGIDAAAHRGALAAGGVTVGVLGGALDMFYPRENLSLARDIAQRGGAVVSEFPFGRPPDRHTFPQRNHTVAALSAGVIAVEAPFKSGTLITTSMAAELGRTVMALPGRLTDPLSEGCLALIRDGAVLVRGSRDVAEAMSELLPLAPPTAAAPAAARAPTPEPIASPEEALVMRHVTADGLSIDELAAATGLKAEKVSSLVMLLQLKDRLRLLPGNRVALPRSR